ncbi:MAG: hypothetical protein PHX92_00025 [Candidatus Pacebacteria bacterium]|nr:hypothetical protein [Candidatus Paceibacterota bacterium]
MNKKLIIFLILLGLLAIFLFVNSNQENLLIGKWKSLDDSNYSIEITKDKIIDYYSGEIVSEDYYTINKNIIRVAFNEEFLEYEILELSKEKLSLIYLLTGKTLNYTKN